MPAPAPAVPFLTARNPRALVEVVLGRPVDWATIADPRALVETVLETPYADLFDPVHDSPVYLGFERDDDGRMTSRRPRFTTIEDQGGNDDDRFPTIDLDEIHHLADLKVLAGVAAEELPVRRLVPSRAGGWTIEIGPAPATRDATLARLFPKDVLDRIWDHVFPVDLGWTPDGGQWVDGGRFFDEAAEFFDPIQGALADCWLVAAMSSVAWALPYTIAQRSRATGTPNERFTNLFELTDPADGTTHSFEATDEIVVWSGTTTPMYSRSSETGEIWPALVEKAYAMWRGKTANDHPNITVLNGGDPVAASAALTGRTPQYTSTAGSTSTELITLVKAHSQGYRTIDPMTAWTYGTGADSPDHVVYEDANLVANHSYSVLGWATGPQLLRPELVDVDLLWRLREERGGGERAATGVRHPLDLDVDLAWRLKQDYLVLRNPWGYHEATRGSLGGVIPMRDVSFWRSIDLAQVDGVFAIDLPTFKRYFAGIGVAV